MRYSARHAGAEPIPHDLLRELRADHRVHMDRIALDVSALRERMSDCEHSLKDETPPLTVNYEPAHLRNFPCMRPWIGLNYKSSKLLIVCESHFLPDCITKLHHDAETWYRARQSCIPNPIIHHDADVRAHSYMDTIASIEHYKCRKHIHKAGNKTYKKIEKSTGMSFDDFAFFNYIFRPVDKSSRGYCRHNRFKITDKDKKISKEIMEWFIHEHDPKKIVIASTCVETYGGAKDVLDKYRCIEILYTRHPTAINGHLPEFGHAIPDFIYGMELE